MDHRELGFARMMNELLPKVSMIPVIVTCVYQHKACGLTQHTDLGLTQPHSRFLDLLATRQRLSNYFTTGLVCAHSNSFLAALDVQHAEYIAKS